MAWDVHQGPKNYVVLVGAQVASSFLSFAAVWLVTRLLGSTGYGGVVAIIAASQVIAMLFVNWTAISLSRYGVEEFVKTGRLARAFWTRFWILLATLSLVVATSPLWLPPISSLLKLPPQAYPFVLGHFVATALWTHVQQGLQGAKLMRLQCSLLTLERALVFLIVVACALTGTTSFLTVALAYIFAPLGAAAVGLWAVRQLIFPISGVERGLLSRMLSFSLPILPASLIGYMSTNWLDAFFITRYLSAAHLGVYSVAYQVSGTFLQLPLLAGSLLMPLFVTLEASGQNERKKNFVSHTLPSLTLLWVIACAGMAFVGSYLMPVIFGVTFSQAADLLWPLMAAVAIAGPVQMAYNPIVNARSATYITMIASIAAAITNLVLDVVLIPRFGLIGAAWATTAAFGVHVIIQISLVHARLLSMPSWTIQATFPIVLGAAFELQFGGGLVPLLVTLFTAALLAIGHRAAITKSFALLNEHGRRAFLSRMP